MWLFSYIAKQYPYNSLIVSYKSFFIVVNQLNYLLWLNGGNIFPVADTHSYK